MTDDMLPSWIKEKEDEADKDLNYEGKHEFDNKKELQDDFLSKMIHRKGLCQNTRMTQKWLWESFV